MLQLELPSPNRHSLALPRLCADFQIHTCIICDRGKRVDTLAPLAPFGAVQDSLDAFRAPFGTVQDSVDAFRVPVELYPSLSSGS